MASNPNRYPVNTVADVLALVPSYLRPDDAAPVRDAILAGLTALCLEIQDWAEYAAAQANVLTATGKYEDAIGTERETFRNGADDEPYRANILAPPAVVTPTAVLAAANAILAPFTSVTAKYAESIGDRHYLRDDGAVQNPPGMPQAPFAYVYDESSVPRSPDYPDRLYESEGAQNGGFFVPGREPGAALLFGDDVGREFLLRVPDLTSLDAEDTPVYDDLQPNGFYVSEGEANAFESYVLDGATTSQTLYGTLCNAVTRIKGQSIRWVLVADPNLGS